MYSNKHNINRFTTEGTENTEFYFVNNAYGVVDNTKLFSVFSVPSVVKRFLVFDCQITFKTLQILHVNYSG